MSAIIPTIDGTVQEMAVGRKPKEEYQAGMLPGQHGNDTDSPHPRGGVVIFEYFSLADAHKCIQRSHCGSS